MIRGSIVAKTVIILVSNRIEINKLNIKKKLYGSKDQSRHWLFV